MIVKRTHFSWIIQVSSAGNILSQQAAWGATLFFIIYFLCWVFRVSLPHQESETECHSAIFLLEKWHPLIDIDCLRSQCRPPAINLYISEKTNPRSDVLLSQFRRGSARDRARGYNLHFIKANFTLNISSGSLSHFLSQREK